MPQITFRLPSGDIREVTVDAGTTVMRAALSNDVPGIVGECGGQAMCATCHVYVDESQLDVLPGMSEDEEEMLEVTAAERDEDTSRLSCQLPVGGRLEQLTVTVPDTQI